jgi:Ca2+:H+ antiporter
MSRIFLHNPPGEGNALKVAADAPEAVKHKEHELVAEDPEISPWACIVLLVITVAIMAATAEFVSILNVCCV